MGQSAVELAVIVPTYGEYPFAFRAAESALASVPDSVVLVVDDGHRDWSPSHFRFLPKGRVVLHHFGAREKSIARSWSWGLARAAEMGAAYAICSNSDVLFPAGFWPPIRSALDSAGGLDIAGPLTNAPGHQPEQQVADRLPGFKVSDRQKDVDRVQRDLFAKYGGRVRLVDKVNGFTMAASLPSWRRAAHAWPHATFDPSPKYRMMRSEDRLEGEAARRGMRIGIVLGSYVMHYRGLSRGSTRGKEGRGYYRPKKGRP